MSGHVTCTSRAAEPVVAAVFPEPARETIGHVHCRDPFRVLESELGGNPQLERIAVARGQDIVGDLEGEDGLRMQRGGHVDARIVAVGAFEPDIPRRRIGADVLQECAEGHSGPFADHAPAFDADVSRDLRFLRQPMELGQAPGPAIVDEAGKVKLERLAIELGNLALAVIGVIPKILDRPALRIGRHQPPRIE